MKKPYVLVQWEGYEWSHVESYFDEMVADGYEPMSVMVKRYPDETGTSYLVHAVWKLVETQAGQHVCVKCGNDANSVGANGCDHTRLVTARWENGV